MKKKVNNKTNQELLQEVELELEVNRLKKSEFNKKQYKYEDDKLKMLALDAEAGSLLLQIDDLKFRINQGDK